MNAQKAMEYCRLNLQRCALKLEGEDKKKLTELEQKLRAIRNADDAFSGFHSEMNSKLFHFESMGLLYWAVVCVSAMMLPLNEYLETGITVVSPGLFWPAYIIPVVLLVIRFFFGLSVLNIAHIVLAAICALLTFLKITIFGSEMNWVWVFILVGTLITLVGRILESNLHVKPNMKWYTEQKQTILAGEKAIKEASGLFASIGASAAGQIRSQFPGANLSARNPWFDFSRTKTRGTPKEDKIPEVETDFETHKRNYHKNIPDTQSTTYRVAVIMEQKLDFELIDRDTAMQYIREKKVVPFFGLTEQPGNDDLRYLIYVHHWVENRHDVIHVDYEKTTYTYTGEKTKAKQEMDDNEWSVLGIDAESFMLRTDSAAAREYAREYISRKESKLNSMSDYRSKTRHVEYEAERDDLVTFHEIATLSVTTADGEPVALYCANNRQAIDFADKMAKDYWNAGITPACAPQNPVQAAYLYQRYFG